MTVTYLDQPATAVLDASGNGIATYKVPTGSFLIPRFARVTTGVQTAPVAKCTLYHGAVTVTSVGTYVDDTALGNSDSTTALAGGVVKFGEAITAVWSGGTPGDSAVLNIVGLYTDNLPEALQYITTPGARFAGHLVAETVNVLTSNTVVLTHGTAFVAPLFDVRQYSSYYLQVAAKSSGAATGYNPILTQLFWQPSTGIGANPTYSDELEIWADSNSGSFVNILGNLYAQDIMHGPYIQPIFQSNAAADTLSVQYTLFGTTRILPSPFVRQNTGMDNILIDIPSQLLVSGTAQVPLPIAYGDVDILFANNSGANSMNPSIGFGSTSHGFGANTDSLGTVAAGASIGRNPPYRKAFPKRAGILNVSGTGSDGFSVRMTATLVRS